MTQPYCYWVLNTPLVRIIGLNSNVDGLLDAPGTTEQESWLHNQLSGLHASDTIIAVHHCPYSLDSNHGGYGAIAESLEAQPFAAVFSGHVHNYQRFKKGVPYVIAGAGGYANNGQGMHKLSKEIGDVPVETSIEGLTLESYNETAPGFLRISATKTGYTGEYFTVKFGSDEAKLFDTFSF